MSASSTGSEDRDKFHVPPPLGGRPFQAPVEYPKPDIVKRATSNQNENTETRPYLEGQSVKKAALNREGSLASNRLKAKYLPGYFDSTKEVEKLSNNLRQSSISEAPRPVALDANDRMSTLDMQSIDLAVKPAALGSTSRSTTIDALALELDDDAGEFFADSTKLPKPKSLASDLRLTTTDLIDIVNEPLAEV